MKHDFPRIPMARSSEPILFSGSLSIFVFFFSTSRIGDSQWGKLA